jgi:hypothetical protein
VWNHTSNPLICLHGLDRETFTFRLCFLTSCRGVAGWGGVSVAAAPGSRFQGATKWTFQMKTKVYVLPLKILIIEPNKGKNTGDYYFLKFIISVRNNHYNWWSAGAKMYYLQHCLLLRTLCFEIRGTFYGRRDQGQICLFVASMVVSRRSGAALR